MLRSAIPWLVAGLIVLLVSGAVVVGGQMTPFAAPPARSTVTAAPRSTEILTNGNLQDAVDSPERFASAPVQITGRVAGTQTDSSTGAGTFLLSPDPPSGVIVAVEPPIGRAPTSSGTMVRVDGVFTHVGTTQLGGGAEARVPYVVANEVEVLALEGPATPSIEPGAADATPPATSAPVETTPSAETPIAAETPVDATASAEPDSAAAQSPTAVETATAEPGSTPSESPTHALTSTPLVAATSIPATTPTSGVTPSVIATPSVAPSPSSTASSPTPAPAASVPVVKVQSADGGAAEARFAAAGMARGAGFSIAGPASGGDAGVVVTGETNKDWSGRGPTPRGGEAQMSVDVPSAGDYAIWVRMRYRDLDANSVWLRVDNGQVYKVGNDDTGYGAWKWVGWSDGDTNRRVVVRLDPGQHTITLVSRETGTEIDSILVTSDTKTRP